MKSYDFEAVTYDGAVYCVDCLPDGVKIDDCCPVFADSEWDSYPVCDNCGAVHDYVNLTTYGQKIADVQQAIFEYERGEFDGLAVDDLSAVPDNYDGAVLLINDHGNVTLYSVNDGTFKEIGAVV